MGNFPEIPFIEKLLLDLIPFMTHDRIWLLIRLLIFPGILFASVMVWPNVWIERKMWGRIHDRRGPTHIGFRGILQLMADFVKLLSKEVIIPKNAHKVVFRLIPMASLFIAFMAFSLLPFDENWALFYNTDTPNLDCSAVGGILPSGCNYLNYDLLLLYALLTAIPVLGILAGWAAGSKYPIIGGWRFANQQFAIEVPLLLSTLGPAILTGSLSLMVISVTQQANVWFIFILPLSFITFAAAGIASVGRWPFDIHEADSEIVLGPRTEYSGALFMMAFMGQYVEIFMFAGTIVTFFLGGGQLIPFVANLDIPLIGDIITKFPTWVPIPALIFIGKMVGVFFVFIIVTNTLHRIRMDQILRLMWRILIPLTLINIMGVMLGIALFPGFREFLGLM